MSFPKKHHFLPVFYLRQWAGSDGRLVEFKKAYRSKVVPRRGHPQSMGWIDRLYAVEGVPDAEAHAFESAFLSPVDSRAAQALRAMLDTAGPPGFTADQKQAWSDFLISLMARMPEDIEKLKRYSGREWLSSIRDLPEEYLRHRHATDPPTLNDYLSTPTSVSVLNNAGIVAAKSILGNRQLQSIIAAMYWAILVTDDCRHELLTSDRPIIHTPSLNAPDSHILLPLGPRRLFAAVADQTFLNDLRGRGHDILVQRMNEYVVSAASRYVFATSDRQLRFVQNRIGSDSGDSLIDRMRKKQASLQI